MTALVDSGLHTCLYRGYVQVYWLVYRTRVYTSTRGGKLNGSPQGSPRALASAGKRGGQRYPLRWCPLALQIPRGVRWHGGFRGGVRWRGGFRYCGGVDGAAGPGHAKTSALDRKTVPGPLCGGAAIEGLEAKGCATDTRLATAEPPGRLFLVVGRGDADCQARRPRPYRPSGDLRRWFPLLSSRWRNWRKRERHTLVEAK